MSRDFTVEELSVRVFDDVQTLARAAVADAVEAMRRAIRDRGEANIMLATGNSQLVFLAALMEHGDVDWSQVTAFHMDEYVDLPATHTASFHRYMREKVGARLPLRQFHYLHGDTGDAQAEVDRYAGLLRSHPLDLCVCGFGENGHLAFNDPPVADFDDPVGVKVVALESASRRQQVAEGHFATIDDVPTHAITVTIPALVRAGRLLAIVPELRKAVPVRDALLGPIATSCPASLLRRQPHATLYLDVDSASLLDQ